MILVGRYRSPFTRRVAISMRLLGMAYEQKPQSALQQLEAVQEVNPLGRVPALILDDGEVLFDSWAILDWLDHAVEPERRLVPEAEPERHQPWVERCAAQVAAGLATLDRLEPDPWFVAGRRTQADVTAAVMAAFVRFSVPELLPEQRYPALDAVLLRWEDTEEFRQTQPEP